MRPFVFLLLMVCCGASMAQQDPLVVPSRPPAYWDAYGDLKAWPMWNLSDNDILKLRHLTGIPDSAPDSAVVVADAKNLPGMRILFATAQDNCMSVHVFEPMFLTFRQVWKSDATPDGRRYCSEPGCGSPYASASHQDMIGVYVPIRKSGECDEFLSFRYRAGEHGYQLEKEEILPAICPYKYQFELLHDAAVKHVPGEVIATISAGRALMRGSYTLALTRQYGQVHAYRTYIKSSPFPLSINSQMTRAECRDIAAGLSYTPKEVTDSILKLEKLTSELSGIDLAMDACAKNKKRSCDVMVDGGIYTVRVPGHSPIQLLDTEEDSKMLNKNPALFRWVLEVLKATNSTWKQVLYQ